jgi:hypothetical protein
MPEEALAASGLFSSRVEAKKRHGQPGHNHTYDIIF